MCNLTVARNTNEAWFSHCIHFAWIYHVNLSFKRCTLSTTSPIIQGRKNGLFYTASIYSFNVFVLQNTQWSCDGVAGRPANTWNQLVLGLTLVWTISHALHNSSIVKEYFLAGLVYCAHPTQLYFILSQHRWRRIHTVDGGTDLRHSRLLYYTFRQFV